MKMIAITSLCLFVSACASRPLDGGADSDGGGSAPTGLYKLVETRTSDCVPLVDGDIDILMASVVSDGQSTVNLWFSDTYFPTTPPTETGHSWGSTDVIDGSATSDVVNCNVNQHRVITIEAQSPTTIAARVVDTFSNVAHLTQPCFDIGGLPAQDCSVTDELRYTLAQPCAAACIQEVEPPTGKAGAPTFQCGC